MTLVFGPVLRGEPLERPERLEARFALEGRDFLASLARLLELPAAGQVHRLRPDLGLAVSLECDGFAIVLRHASAPALALTASKLPQVLITLPGTDLATFEQQLKFANALRARRRLVPLSQQEFMARAAQSALAA